MMTRTPQPWRPWRPRQTARRRGLLAALAAAWLAGSQAAPASSTTYQVNLAQPLAEGSFDPAHGDAVVVAGTFSTRPWSLSPPLQPVAGQPGVYAGTFEVRLAPGATEAHKFVIQPGGGAAAGGEVWESGDNRSFVVPAGPQVLPVVDFDHLQTPPARPATARRLGPLAGADMSLLPYFESRGAAYRAHGQVQDALGILKAEGFNCVRLRLFTSSPAQARANPYDYINNLDYTLPLAVRVKQAGLQLLVDFHYSDSWADPGKQRKPAAWAGLDFAGLTEAVRAYSSNSIARLVAAGARPDWVQVGNEITPGMLWDEGRVSGSQADANHWPQLARLLQAAIQGVKSAAGSPSPKIIIHIDRGGDWKTTKWFFDHLIEEQQVPFDAIAESYYPWWHGSLQDLAACLDHTARRYGKPVLVAETAFPWTNSVYTTNIAGLPGTLDGQTRYVRQLADVIQHVPNGLGAGVFWWGAEYQNLRQGNQAGFQTTSLFDAGGNVVPAAALFGARFSSGNWSGGLAGAAPP